MSNLDPSALEDDPNDNQFLPNHSQSYFSMTEQHQQRRSIILANDASFPSNNSHPQPSENNAENAIQIGTQSIGGLDSKNKEVCNQEEQQQMEENQFMLDERSLVASISNGLVKVQGEFSSKIKNESYFIANHSNDSNLFGQESRLKDKIQNDNSQQYREEDPFMGIQSEKPLRQSTPHNQSQFQQNAQLKQRSQNIERQSQFLINSPTNQLQVNSQQSNLQSNKFKDSELQFRNQFIQKRQQEEKVIQFLNNSFSKQQIQVNNSHSNDIQIGQIKQPLSYQSNIQPSIQNYQAQPSELRKSKQAENDFSDLMNQQSHQSDPLKEVDNSIGTSPLHIQSGQGQASNRSKVIVPNEMKRSRHMKFKQIESNRQSQPESQVNQKHSSIINHYHIADPSEKSKRQINPQQFLGEPLQKQAVKKQEQSDQIQLLESQVMVYQRQKTQIQFVQRQSQKQQKIKSQHHIQHQLGSDSLRQKQKQQSKNDWNAQQAFSQQNFGNLSARILEPLQRRSIQKSRKIDPNQNSKVQSHKSQQVLSDKSVQSYQNMLQQQQQNQQLLTSLRERSQIGNIQSNISLKSNHHSEKSASQIQGKVNRQLIEQQQHPPLCLSNRYQNEIKEQNKFSNSKRFNISNLKQKVENQSQNLSASTKKIKSRIHITPKNQIYSQQKQIQMKESFKNGQYQQSMVSNKNASSILNECQSNSSKNFRKSIKQSFLPSIDDKRTQSKKQSNSSKIGINSQQLIIKNISRDIEGSNQFQSKNNLLSGAISIGHDETENTTIKKLRTSSKEQKIFNTFPTNSIFQQFHQKQGQNYHILEQNHKFSPINQAKIDHLQREKPILENVKQILTGKKIQKPFKTSQINREDQVERIKALKQAQRKRLQRQLQKVTKQIEQINIQQRKMDKLCQEKQKLETQEKITRQMQPKTTSSHQERYKRQSQAMLKMVMEHRKSKANQQLQFEDIDRNITNNLVQLNRIRHQAEQKIKQKKRLEIVDRMKKNEIRKMNELKQMKANIQYVQQFKSEDPKFYQKTQSPQKQANKVHYMIPLNEKMKRQQQNEKINSNNINNINKQHKTAKITKIKSVGKKRTNNIYENSLD